MKIILSDAEVIGIFKNHINELFSITHNSQTVSVLDKNNPEMPIINFFIEVEID